MVKRLDRRRTSPARNLPGRRLRLERLCDRRVLASISGMVFDDANISFRFDSGEAGLEDRLVYLDLNNDGVPNAADRVARTDAAGQFRFEDVAPGSYTVRLFNGTASQTQTVPVAAELADEVLPNDDVALAGWSHDGQLIGFRAESVVRVDPDTGSEESLDLDGLPSGFQSLPDGRLVVLEALDPEGLETTGAWLVDFSTSTVSPLDFGLGEGERGWASVAINEDGDGLLVPAASESAAPVRELSFLQGAVVTEITDQEVPAGTIAMTGVQSPAAVIAIPQADGLQLQMWSNALGGPILGAGTRIADGAALEAFDEASGMVVVSTLDGQIQVFDGDNDFALLASIDQPLTAVAVDGPRMRLYGRSATGNLVVRDLVTGTSRGGVSFNTERSGAMLLTNDARQIVVGGVESIAKVDLDIAQAIPVTVAAGAEVTDALFGLSLDDPNAAPQFSGDYEFNLLEDTTLARAAPTLLGFASDADEGDSFVVFRSGDAAAGEAVVGPDGRLLYRPDENFFGQDGFEIELHDGRAVGDTAAVRLNVLPVEDPFGPVIVDVPAIPELVAPGDPLGPVAVVNPDLHQPIQIFVDDPRFIVEGGQLILAEDAGLDFEQEQEIWIEVTAVHSDSASSSTTAYMLEILDENEPIRGLTLDHQTVLENAAGETIGQLTVDDEDLNGDYEFTVDDDRFVIDADEMVLKLKEGVALDHEVDDPTEVTITVADADYEFEETFQIRVADVPEAATSFSFAGSTLRERVAGAVVGELLIDDPDRPINAQLNVDDSRFEFAGTMLKLRDGVSVRYSEQQQIHLVLSVFDSGSPDFSGTLDVTLDVLENTHPFHNDTAPADVDGNGDVEPVDALVIINYLNHHGPGPLEHALLEGAEMYYDVNGDDRVTPLDALLVINQLNRGNRPTGTVGGGQPEEGEPQGEAPADEGTDVDASAEKRSGTFASPTGVVDQALGSLFQSGQADDEDEDGDDEDAPSWQLR